MKKSAMVGTLFFSIPCLLPAQTGPGGVGTADGLSALELWLRADSGVVATGSTVTSWDDQSGNGRNMPAFGGPTLMSSVYNGLPVVDFDGTDDSFSITSNLPLASGDDDYTYFAVFQGASGDQVVLEQNSSSMMTGTRGCMLVYNSGLWGFNGESADAPLASYSAGTTYLGTMQRLNQASDNVICRSNGSLFLGTVDNAVANVGAGIFTLGYKGSANNEFLNGHIAEALVYSSALSNVELKLVEEYLAAKYALTYSGGLYTGDDNVSGDFDQDVAGIGTESSALNASASSSGLSVIDQGFLTDSGDYLLIGHNVATNGLTTADVPAGIDRRWTRSWYFDRTDVGTSGGNVNLVFDFSDAGLSATPSANLSDYVLLARTGTSGGYGQQATATSITGDQVTFTVDASALTDGANYTLGSANGATLPVGINQFVLE